MSRRIAIRFSCCPTMQSVPVAGWLEIRGAPSAGRQRARALGLCPGSGDRQHSLARLAGDGGGAAASGRRTPYPNFARRGYRSGQAAAETEPAAGTGGGPHSRNRPVSTRRGAWPVRTAAYVAARSAGKPKTSELRLPRSRGSRLWQNHHDVLIEDGDSRFRSRRPAFPVSSGAARTSTRFGTCIGDRVPCRRFSAAVRSYVNSDRSEWLARVTGGDGSACR